MIMNIQSRSRNMLAEMSGLQLASVRRLKREWLFGHWAPTAENSKQEYEHNTADVINAELNVCCTCNQVKLNFTMNYKVMLRS